MNKLIYNECLERALDFGNYFWKNPVANFIGDNIDVHLPDGNIFKPDFSVICDKNIIKENGKT